MMYQPSARRTMGIILIASSSIGITIGFVLSATGVGALCGIPLILICIITLIWGYLMKAKDKVIREERVAERMLMTQAVASGVNICPKCRTPNPNTNSHCGSCGQPFDPQRNPRPISAIDPAEAALHTKGAADWSSSTAFEPEDTV